ncbi:DUF6919 domain-containing protein [Nonomuraea salmonea]|uniref:DUF6919 domain-containing protein n=1 Tax=Nonomuraea salmonea TaxID=46181 RepID=A0ABV5P2S3_9ACTN
MEDWQTATTLHDLGELTARWLEGAGGHPGYDGRPDEETLPIAGHLAAANRSGYVTYSSQPEFHGPGYDGATWWQRAAVEGLTDQAGLDRLRRAAARHPRLHIVAQTAARVRTSYKEAVPVSAREDGGPRGMLGQPRLEETTCAFGARLPVRELVLMFGGQVSPALRRVLRGAVQVTIADRYWGLESPLWGALDEFAAR